MIICVESFLDSDPLTGPISVPSLCGVEISPMGAWPKSVLLSHVLHASTVVLRDSDGGRVTLMINSDTASVTGGWRSYSLVSRDPRSWVGYACCSARHWAAQWNICRRSIRRDGFDDVCVALLFCGEGIHGGDLMSWSFVGVKISRRRYCTLMR